MSLHIEQGSGRVRSGQGQLCNRGAALLGASVVVALGLSLLGAPVPSSSATLMAVEAVGALAADPAPPADVVGAPSNRTILSSADLLISRTVETCCEVSHTWVETDARTTKMAATGTALPDAPVAAATEDVVAFPTAAGRFTNAEVDQVLALQEVSFVDQTLQLTEVSSQAESATEGWATLEEQSGPVPGLTSILEIAETDTVIAHAEGGAPVVLTDRPRQGALPSMGVQWTVIADGSSLRFLSRADGSCLAPVETATGLLLSSATCESGDTGQLWTTESIAGLDLLQHVETKAFLDVDEVGQVTVGGDDLGVGITYSAVTERAGIAPSWSIAMDRNDAPFDLAAGDLDNSVSESSEYNDEAAIAYTDGDGVLRVRVIDYNAGDVPLLVSEPTSGEHTVESGAVTVDIADFNGDGVNEIAATWHDDRDVINVDFFGYTSEADGSRTLAFLATAQLPVAAELEWGDSAAWDFNGDGRADLAVAYANVFDNSAVGLAYAFFDEEFTLTSSFNPGRAIFGGTTVGNPPVYAAKSVGQHATVQLSLGSFDPAEAADPAQRQVAIAVQTDSVVMIAVNGYRSPAAPGGEGNQYLYLRELPSNGGSGGSSIEGVSIASGVFGGPVDGAASWGIAVSYGLPVPAQDPVVFQRAVALVMPAADGWTLNTWIPEPAQELDVFYTITAYDRSGDSLILGPPVVFDVEQLVQPTLMAGQPPAHSDWLDGEFVNVSRNQDLSVSIGSTSSSGYSNSTSTSSDQTYQVSESADVIGTVSLGLPKVEGGSASLEVSQKFDYDWDTKKSSLSAFGGSTSNSVTEATQDDDIVDAQIRAFRVFRYPVLGTRGTADSADGTCQVACSGYWEVTVPGTVVEANAPGKSLSFFQPSWQNGNALSYPQLVNEQVPMADLGSYSTVDAKGAPITSSSPLLTDHTALGGIKHAVTLAIGTSGSTSSSETSTQSWNVGVDVTAKMKASTSIPGASSTLDASLSTGFDASREFGGSTTGSTSNSHGSSFVLSIPEVDGNRGYTIGTSYYYSTGGYPKVAYGVDLLANAEASEWWQSNYGTKSDPALNLPFSTVLGFDQYNYLDVPEWSQLSSRQTIRGFAVRHPVDPSSPVVSGSTYAAAPLAGDQVVFDVDVHNYSLQSMTEALSVTFYAVPVDVRGLEVEGPPQLIGTTLATGDIDPQSMVTVSSPTWTAIAADGGAAQNYRIFTVLDEEDSIDEVHEWAGDGTDTCPGTSLQDGKVGTVLTDPRTGQPETLTCGQNNQGYGMVSVQGAPLEGAERVGDSASANVTLRGAGLVTGDPEHLELHTGSKVPTIPIDRTTTGLVHARADSSSRAQQTVLVYDGLPADGELIAATELYGVDSDNGGTARYDWTPRRSGLHELHQVILGGAGAGERQEQIVRVQVSGASVSPAPPAGDGGDGAGTAPDGRGNDSADSGSGRGDLAATGWVGGWAILLAIGLVLTGAGLRLVRRRRSSRSASPAEETGPSL